MWKDERKKAPVAEFLGWMLFLSILVEGALMLLEPHSILFEESGRLTVGYAV